MPLDLLVQSDADLILSGRGGLNGQDDHVTPPAREVQGDLTTRFGKGTEPFDHLAGLQHHEDTSRPFLAVLDTTL